MFVHDPIIVPAQQGIECPVCLKRALSISTTTLQVAAPYDRLRAQYSARCDECGFYLERTPQEEMPLRQVVADAVKAEIARFAYLTGGRPGYGHLAPPSGSTSNEVGLVGTRNTSE